MEFAVVQVSASPYFNYFFTQIAVYLIPMVPIAICLKIAARS